jgi:hypothetical protein
MHVAWPYAQIFFAKKDKLNTQVLLRIRIEISFVSFESIAEEISAMYQLGGHALWGCAGACRRDEFCPIVVGFGLLRVASGEPPPRATPDLTSRSIASDHTLTP